MAKHVKLPSNDEPKPKVSTPAPATHLQVGGIPMQVIRDRATLQVDTGDFVYCARLKLQDSSLAGFVFLTHKAKWSREDLERMLSEAIKVCNDIRIPNRREEMATAKTQIDDAVKINEVWFEGDVEFVEAVMCDKFQFRKLIHSSVAGEVNRTINI
jgi:hypothetical protein